MGEKRGMKALEAWCRKVTHGYRDVKINNMTTAWRDGLAFCAIIHHFQPDLIDYESLSKENIFHNNDLAFSMAERLGIPALLDAEDMVNYKVPDKLSILTYVSQLYQHFHSLETPSPAKRALEEENDQVAEANESREKRLASDVPLATAATPSHPRTDVCQACKNRVYILERLIVDNKLYHRTCFKCLKCRTVLSPGSYVECDQSDRYECIQCPLQEEKSANGRLSQDVLRRFSETQRAEPAACESLIRAKSPTATGKPTPPEEEPKPPIIATAATQARLQFHARNLSSSEVEIPIASKTGQTPPLSVVDRIPNLSNSSPVIVSSFRDAVVTLPSDIQNNNVKGQLVKSTANEAYQGAIKPAIPQKPTLVPERPRSLPIQRPITTTKDVIVSPGLRTSLGDLAKSETVVGDNVEPVSQSHRATLVSENTLTENASEHFIIAEEKITENSNRAQMEAKADTMPNSNKENLDSYVKVAIENKLDAELPSANIPGEINRPAPVAAPRVSRTKRQIVKVPTDDRNEEKAVPVPPKRTVVSRKCDPDSTTTPPKPPRRPSLPEGAEGLENKKEGTAITIVTDYPLELNPFGDDDDGDVGEEVKCKETELGDMATKEKVSLNPFGDSDEEEELPLAPVPNQRRLVPCYVNPFSSDSDGDSEGGATRYSVSPVPSLHVVPLPRPQLNQKGSRDATTLRKKRPAPKPPSQASSEFHSPTGTGSATPSPRLTPQTTPRTVQKSPGPTALAHPIRRPDAITLRANESDSLLMEKSLKELDNMNRTKVVHGSEESPSKPACLPNSADESNSSSDINARPANTFGNWKKKKKRAPPLPIPRRRQIASISIKEIQIELIEIEEKHLELEKQGVEIEKNIREKFNDEIDPSTEEENLILQLFDLVNKKNELFRRQTELTYLKRQQRLEEEHADLEFQIRCLMEKPAHKKTDEDRALEDQLIARLVEVVTQRSEIIESMEMDRVREAEEDQSIQHQISMQLNQSNRGSISSQGSLGVGGSIPSSSSSGKDKTKKTKKEKKQKASKVKDEDKDTDETESKKKVTIKEKKKKKWF